MLEAAEVLRLSNARDRQVAGLRRALVASGKLVSGCLLTTAILLTVVCGLPVLILALFVLPGILTGWLEKVSWLIALVPFPLSIFVFGIGAVMLVRGALLRLEEACAAVPPAAPGESATCHVCGAPLTTVGESGVARCGFCQADNVVTARAIDRARRRRDVIMESYARGIGVLSLKVHSVSALGTVGWLVAVVVTAVGSCTAAQLYDAHLATTKGPQGAQKLANTKGQSMVVDASAVFLCVGNTVKSVPVGGGTPSEVAAEPYAMATDYSLVGDASNLYWMSSKGEVRRVSKGGGPIATIAQVPGVARANLRMAIDADALYVTTERALMRVPKSGGAPAKVADLKFPPGEVEVDASHVYWFEDSLGGDSPDHLRKVSKAGGEVTTLYSRDSIRASVRPVLDETSIYYVANYGNSINRQSKSGGEPKRIVSNDDTDIHQLALDGDWLYFATQYDGMIGCSGESYGAIRRVRKDGGKVEELTSGLKTPMSLIVSGGYVYWGDLYRDTLMRMPKRP